MEKEKIDEILRNHKELLDTNGEKGKRADFSHAHLHGADFSGLDLSHANFIGAHLSNVNFEGTILNGANFNKAELIYVNFHKTDLSHADLSYSDLRCSDLHEADLSCSDLHEADLKGANLSNVNFRGTFLIGADLRGVNLHGTKILKSNLLRGAILPDEIYMIEGAGSRHRCTYYDPVNDFVKCGCWDDDNGNHLKSFKRRVKDTYGKNGKAPNENYYKEYKAVIRFFEVFRDEYEHKMDNLPQ